MLTGRTHERALLQVETVATRERLEALAGAWAELWGRCPAATPFQSPQWLLPWWRHLGGAELCSFAAFAGGHLRALVPLFRYTDPANRRRLVLLGTGITDIQNALIEPGLERPVLALFERWLATEAPAWDECDFQQLPEGSPLLECGMRNAECGIFHWGAWQLELSSQDPCPAITLPGRAVALAAVIPGPILKKVRYYDRRMRGVGEYRIEGATAENFEELFQAFLDLHGARWNARGEQGVLADAAVAAFHWDAARAMLQAGMLRLYALRLDGRIIACIYGFFHGRGVYYYLGGFDPAFKELSPSTLTIAHGIAEAAREGTREFNFLRGREPYKYRWGARDHPCSRLQIKKDTSATNNIQQTSDIGHWTFDI